MKNLLSLRHVCVCVAIFTPFSELPLARPYDTTENSLLSLSALSVFCNFRQSSFKDFSSRRLFSHMKNCGEIIFFINAAQEFSCGNFLATLKENFMSQTIKYFA
jgi:hypothetical protein